MPEERPPTPPAEAQKDQGWSPPLTCIVAALVILVAAVVIGAQVFRALYALIFHPAPPLPESRTQLEHQNLDFGVDNWIYTTDMNPCELAQFYKTEGSSCSIGDGLCSGSTYTGPDYGLDEIAICIGTEPYSIFDIRWESRIYTQRIRGENITKFDIQRDMLWSGPAPAATTAP